MKALFFHHLLFLLSPLGGKKKRAGHMLFVTLCCKCTRLCLYLYLLSLSTPTKYSLYLQVTTSYFVLYLKNCAINKDCVCCVGVMEKDSLNS